MQLAVTLASHPAAWRFPGSAGTERWFQERPWLKDGGVRVLWGRSPAMLELLAEAVRGDIYGIERARTDLRVHAFEAATGTELRSHIAHRLNLCVPPTEFQRLVELARALELQPRVFLVFASSQAAGSVVDAADQLVDAVDKVGGAIRPTLIVLVANADGVRGLPDDFTTGWPIDCDATHGRNHEGEAWQAYLHERLAWEVGGDLELAQRWSDALSPACLALGADDSLESELNRLANSTYQSIASHLRARLEANLAQARSRTAAIARLWTPWVQLRAAGMVWFTPEVQSPEPTPWLARALLLRNLAGSLTPLLRNCLICAPLARQVLAGCFDLEARERTNCASVLPADHAAAPDTQRSYDDFCHNRPYSEAQFYPRACPARPVSAWHFASWCHRAVQNRPEVGESAAGLRG